MKSSWIPFWTLLRRENERTFRVWSQTFLPPVVSAILFVAIFGRVVGDRIGSFGHVAYFEFLVPGMIIMNVLLYAYSGTAFTLFFAKWERYIHDVLIAPMSYIQMVFAIMIGGGLLRALVTGLTVYLALLPFGFVGIMHPFVALYFLVMGGLFFSSFGMIVGLWAERFDHFNIIQTFVLTPLLYLGGVFYSLQTLPQELYVLSRLNPLLYIVDGFRYGMIGFADAPVTFSSLLLGAMTVLSVVGCVCLFRAGYKLRT